MSNFKYSVDIIIPTYQRNDILERELASLASTSLPDNIKNIWIVENGGKCGTEQLVEKFRSSIPVEYLYHNQGSVSLARNLGASTSSSDILIFFDNDMTFRKDTLESYIRAFEKYGEKYFYGGPLTADYETPPPSWIKKYLPSSAKGFNLGTKHTFIDTPDFLGGNLAIFRKHLLSADGYDARCTSGHNKGILGEETRLQERLINLGIKGCYVPRAEVLHYVPTENCSEKWLLQRATRTGKTRASTERLSISKNTLFGVPYFHLSKTVNITLKLILHSFSKGKTKFEFKYKFFVQIGVLKEYFVNRK